MLIKIKGKMILAECNPVENLWDRDNIIINKKMCKH